MYCTNCSVQIAADSHFCNKCGAATTSQASSDFATREPSTGKRLLKRVGIGCGGLLVLFIVVLVAVGLASYDEEGNTIPDGSSNASPPLSASRTPFSLEPTPTPTFDQLRIAAVEVGYDDLFRNNEQYVGELVYFRCEVVQVIDESEGRWTLRVNVTKGEYSWSDTVYLNYSGPRFLEDDIVEFVGKVEGLKSYIAILFNEVTVPEISVVQMKLVTKASNR